MRRHPYLLPVFALGVLAVAAGTLSCDSANPVAPPGSTLTVTANPTQIGLGESSVITVSGFKPDGNRLNPGSEINLTTDLGVLDATVVEIGSDGSASTVLRPDGAPGTATVTAALPAGEAMATATVEIGEAGRQPTLSVTASPSRINIEQDSTISVIARNVDGSPLAGGRVRLRTTLGTLGQETLVTSDAGEARTLLHPGERSGTATVTGSVGSGMEVTVDITILQTQLTVTTNPSIVDVNDLNPAMATDNALNTAEVTVQARDEDSIPLVGGHDVELTATLGLLLPGARDPVMLDDLGEASSTLTLRTGGDGKATATYVAGDRAGTDTVMAFLGNATAGTGSLTLRDAPATVFLSVTPPEVTQGVMSEVMATVRVSNAQGIPLGNELVRFEVSDDTVSFSLDPPAGPVTNNSGEATATLTFSASGIPAGVMSFRITAFVRDVASNEQTIQVQ